MENGGREIEGKYLLFLVGVLLILSLQEIFWNIKLPEATRNWRESTPLFSMKSLPLRKEILP